MDDYIDVAARIVQFYEQHPEGRLRREGQPEIREVGGKTFVIYKALAYRDPEDRFPGQGVAWEPFPGPTNFTRDSELMNAETAAWGRAIVSVGIVANKIASKQEVQNRSANNVTDAEKLANVDKALEPVQPRMISPSQRKLVFARAKAKGMQESEVKAVIDAHTGQATTEGIPLDKLDAVLEEIGQP